MVHYLINMARKIGIVEYEPGDKVRYINNSDLDISVTKVDTRAELTVVEVEQITNSSISYQVCKVTDGNNSTFATAIELMPSDLELRKQWEDLKTKLKGKKSSSSQPRKASESRTTDTSVAANSLKGININIKKK